MKMKEKRLVLGLGALAALLSMVIVAPAAASSWSVVPSPNPSAQNVLQAVAGVSASDLWAVGYELNTSNNQFNLAEHWNGTSWTIVPTPSPGVTQCASLWQNNLNGVAAVSTNDVWVVGFICGAGQPGNNPFLTLTEHWDGSQWSVVTSPNPSNYSSLYGVAALSTNNVWAVGQNYGASEPETLVEHWDGTSWSVIPSPNPSGRTAYLDAVAAVSPTNIWAVGYSGSCCPSPNLTPLIEHYDGNTWNIVSSPFNANSPFNQLNAVMAVAADNIWAVGYQNEDSKGQSGQALIEHWNGAAWSLVNSPLPGAPTYLYGIAAESSKNVWAVGYTFNKAFDVLPVIEYWNGTSWKVEASPDPGTAAQLLGAAAVQSQIWSVGAYSTEAGSYLNDSQTLTIEK
ncbi:MAG: hypothetical protein WCA13_11475 [Terriglobales bacterium]